LAEKFVILLIIPLCATVKIGTSLDDEVAYGLYHLGHREKFFSLYKLIARFLSRCAAFEMTAELVPLQVRHLDRSGELKISEAKSLSIE